MSCKCKRHRISPSYVSAWNACGAYSKANYTCRLLAKECARWAWDNLLSLCCACSWQHFYFAAAAKVPFRPESASVFSWHTCKRTKSGVYSRKSGNLCGALLRCNELSSAYPLMTLPAWRPLIRPTFASIADTLQEVFANKEWWLYEIIYI